MIEKLSGTPTQKCNLLQSSIFDNTHSMNSSRCAESPPSSLQPSFTFLPPRLTEPVCESYYYCSIRGAEEEEVGWGGNCR